jgi:hypothetical protein
VPSVVSRTCEPKPAGRIRAYLLSSAPIRAPVRLLSTRAPRHVVLRASFWLAPCLFRHETLRSPSGQDARCVRSTSAIRNNCVHPHLVRSRRHCRSFRCVVASWSLGSARLDRGIERFHDARTASAGLGITSVWLPRGSSHLTHRLHRRLRDHGHFLPAGVSKTEPLTSLSPLLLLLFLTVAFARNFGSMKEPPRSA